MSWPKTLADELERLESESPEDLAAALDALAVFPADVDQLRTISVWSPCCGRRTSADAVVDARAVPRTVVNYQGQSVDLDWLCDACKTRMIRDKRTPWTMSKYARAFGAPAETIREHRAREVAEERLSEIKGPRNRGEAIDDALSEIPTGTREIDGTDPPQ